MILRKRLVDRDDGNRVQPRTLTVRDYFEGIADLPDPMYRSGWLKRHARKVSPWTMERYVEKVRSHIIPHLGIRRMQELRAAHLDNFYADLLDHGRLDGRGGLAARTVKHIDLDAAVLTVAGAIEETRAGLRFKEPKSKSGRRSIALPASAVEVLRQHKVAQMEERLKLGMGKPDGDTLVFARWTASPTGRETSQRKSPGSPSGPASTSRPTSCAFGTTRITCAEVSI